MSPTQSLCSRWSLLASRSNQGADQIDLVANTGAMNCAPTERVRAVQWSGHGRSTLRPYGEGFQLLERLGDPGAPPDRESSGARREAPPTHKARSSRGAT